MGPMVDTPSDALQTETSPVVPPVVVTPTDGHGTSSATLKRGAIIGTASTYKDAPWADQTVAIYGLNDGYVLPHVARATGWFDLHPFPEMVFRPKGERRVRPEDAPVGGYLRPEGHLDWLRSRPFPVYLHDCQEAECASRPADRRGHDVYPFPTWPNARPFPFRQIRALYGEYFQSTPAWMLSWMLVEGYQQIGIYGIHLATEWEYIHQRPNLEFLIGLALTRGTQFIIPERSTLLKGRHVYGIEPKADLALDALDRTIQQVKAEGMRVQTQLAHVPWYARGRKADLRARLAAVELDVADVRQEQARLTAVARVRI